MVQQMITKACKFEIYPTLEQAELIKKTIGCCRHVWNWALALKKSDRTLNRGQISSMLTAHKKESEYQWLNDVSAQALVAELNHLHDAFQKFFKNCKKNIKGKKGFPRFKSRYKNNKSSFSNQQDVTGKGNRIKETKQGWGVLTIRKFSNIPIRLHKKVNGDIGTVTISMTPTGRYFASVVVKCPGELPPKPLVTEKTTVGIDRGITDLMVLSDGRRVENPKFLKKKLDRLAVLQRRLCKKRMVNSSWKDSRKYAEIKFRIAKLHEEISSKRADYIHKVTHDIISDPKINTIGMETLNVKGMMKNHCLAGSIGDAAWGEITRQIRYKSDWHGKNNHEIDRFEPSSKKCSNCGFVLTALALSVRLWKCPYCSIEHDRDVNAAQNIKQTTLKELLSNSRPGGSTKNKASQSGQDSG